MGINTEKRYAEPLKTYLVIKLSVGYPNYHYKIKLSKHSEDLAARKNR